MTTLSSALNIAISAGGDRQVLHLPGQPPLSLGDLARSGDHIIELAERFGLQPGDTVVLEFARTAWPLFVAAYLGCHRCGLVPAVASAGSSDRVAAAVSGTPARLHIRADIGASAWEDCEVRRLSPESPNRSDTAEYILTSGTTGQPKLVGVTDSARLAIAYRGSEHGRTVALTAPPGTNASQTVLVRALLSPHGAVACVRSWSPASLASVVKRSRASTLLLAPALALALIRSPSFEPVQFASVRTVRLSMAPAAPSVFPEILRAMPWVEITNVYTTTEVWPAGTMMRYGRDDCATIGRPLPGTHLRVATAAGASTGSIQLAHESTRLPDGSLDWRASGDIGRVDSTGNVVLVGRDTDMVTRSGSIVSFTEVEDTALGTGLVDDVAAAAVMDRSGQAALGIVVVWRKRSAEKAIRDIIRKKVGDSAVPTVVRTVDSVPRDPQGKVRRADVEFTLRQTPDTTETVPKSVEEQLAAIWCEVLLRDRVGPDDNFFEMGGDSLTTVICNALVEERLGVLIPLRKHREAPTLRSLANVVCDLT